MSKQRKHKTPIDIILSRAQNLQVSCFGTPIGVTIEASKGTYDAKVLSVTIYSPLKEDKLYVISSSMTREEITQIWGNIKDVVDKLLDELVGHHITAKGNLKQLAP